MLFGIVLGILLTVGAAYVYDSIRHASGLQGEAERPLVNWDVLSRLIRKLFDNLGSALARLTKQSRS
jgi:hypothetical protein